tara:strand:+ start:2445 stop:3764 length:1320 start_codon:yes stop_codon:yes gene_type:complete
MSMIPNDTTAQNSKVMPTGKGVFDKLSPNDNEILNRTPDQEDLQFPQDLGENEYNQFILFTSYETKGEKSSASRRQGARDEVTLGEDIDVVAEENGKLTAALLEAKSFAKRIDEDRTRFSVPASKGGPGLMDSFLADTAFYTNDSIKTIEGSLGEGQAEIDRLDASRDAARDAAKGKETRTLTFGRDSEDFINDRSKSTIEQQKLLGIQRRVSEKGRLRITSATEKSNSNIALYLPNKLVNSGSIGYNNVDLSLLGAAMGIMEGEFQGAGGFLKKKIAAGIDSAASVLGTNLNAEAAFDQATGLVINPRMQSTFQGVNIRGFDFTFSFAPKNQKEAVEVSKIIRAFRKKAHPSLASGGTVLNLPDEFEIRYYKVFNNGVVAENLFLNKLGRCALQAINVDYTPNGINATFPDGSPVRTSLTMQFTELRPLVREDIEEGY